MAIEVSLAKFDAIASGDHNAGQIDYETSSTGISLKKVNHHVTLRSLNKATIAAERTVELKRAFVRAMTTQLGGNAAAIADSIESELQNSLVAEVSSTDIGEMVLDRLRMVDTVSYIRFASVYREFRDIDSFVQEIKNLNLASKRKRAIRSMQEKQSAASELAPAKSACEEKEDGADD